MKNGLNEDKRRKNTINIPNIIYMKIEDETKLAR